MNQLSSITILYIPIGLGALLIFNAGDGEKKGGMIFGTYCMEGEMLLPRWYRKTLEALKRQKVEEETQQQRSKCCPRPWL